VQLEEVLCAGREVLHGYLVSQAMSMACESDGWLAWLLPGGLGTYLDTKRVRMARQRGCARVGDDDLAREGRWN
jgi:hypothetical protein